MRYLALSGLSWKVATEIIYANPNTDVLSCLQSFMVLQQRYNLNASPSIEIFDAVFKKKMGGEMENQTSRGSNNLTSSASSFLLRAADRLMSSIVEALLILSSYLRNDQILIDTRKCDRQIVLTYSVFSAGPA